MPRKQDKKAFYEEPKESLEEEPNRDPITFKRFGAEGVIEVAEKDDATGQDHFWYFHPETFKKLKEKRQGLNPFTRKPMTRFRLISPPSGEKAIYEKTAKVLQKYAKVQLAKKPRADPTQNEKNYDIINDTLTYKGKQFRLDFANWRPTREPRIREFRDFSWYEYQQRGDHEEGDRYLSKIVCLKTAKYKDRFAPGDIIDLGYGYRTNYMYYITIKGTIKRVPHNDMSYATYIPKEVMKPFYDIRETSPEIYRRAVRFYVKFIDDYGMQYGTEYVIHSSNRAANTLRYYTLDERGQPVIRTSSPLHGSAERVFSSIRSPSPLV